jgi:hypothetical protein
LLDSWRYDGEVQESVSADIGPRIGFITLPKAQRNLKGRFER